MKYIQVYVLFLLLFFCNSCTGQNKKDLSKENSKPETKDTAASRWIYTEYEYTDTIGKRVIVQNSFPKSGVRYTDPTGKEHVYAVFWTRIVNETDHPFELSVDFPVESYELPALPGVYYRLFFPADTMTIDKEPLYDYGLTSLKSVLDNGLSKPSALKRTIGPKESGAFYVVTLSNKGMDGPIRTGFAFKGEDVFYSINKNEIHCGKINLKNLILNE
jgi:hypothetical protein